MGAGVVLASIWAMDQWSPGLAPLEVTDSQLRDCLGTCNEFKEWMHVVALVAWNIPCCGCDSPAFLSQLNTLPQI